LLLICLLGTIAVGLCQPQCKQYFQNFISLV
jgi:hypothetical protein